MFVNAGDTIICGVTAPVLHRKAEGTISDVAVMITFSPSQITLSVTFIVMTGRGLTTIWILAVPVHPLAAVPVTEYVAVVAGPIVITGFTEPVFHSNVVPGTLDDTVSVAVAPSHMAVAVVAIESTGFGNTSTVTAPVAVQPSGVVTVILYVVVVVGETVIDEVFPPLLQRNVLPAISLVEVRTELSPKQMSGSAGVNVI